MRLPVQNLGRCLDWSQAITFAKKLPDKRRCPVGIALLNCQQWSHNDWLPTRYPDTPEKWTLLTEDLPESIPADSHILAFRLMMRVNNFPMSCLTLVQMGENDNLYLSEEAQLSHTFTAQVSLREMYRITEPIMAAWEEFNCLRYPKVTLLKDDEYLIAQQVANSLQVTHFALDLQDFLEPYAELYPKLLARAELNSPLLQQAKLIHHALKYPWLSVKQVLKAP